MPDDERNSTRSRAFSLSAALVGLIAILAVIVALTSGGNDDESPAPTRTSPAANTPSNSASATSDSICGLPNGEQKAPTQAPVSNWSLVGRIAAPTDPKTVGPGRTTNGLRSCFAHNPTGALYAAVNVIAATGANSLRDRAVSELFATGQGKEAATAALDATQTDDGTTQLQVAGYTIRASSPDSTVVDLAMQVTTGTGVTSLVHLPMPMSWQDGDWKFEAPPSGETFGAAETLRATQLPASYTSWSGV